MTCVWVTYMANTKDLVGVGIVIGGVIGSLISWNICSLRVDKLKNEFSQYKQEQTQAYNDAVSLANKNLEERRNEFAEKESLLRAEIQNNSVVSRAVTAGRLFVKPACSSSISVQTTPRIDETSTDSIPPSGKPAEEREENFQVINDCAITTLMLNQLQEDIEKQLAKGTQ